MLYMRETLRGVKRGPFSLFCLALGGFWCWNWVVFQSPTSLTILVEGWDVALPSRAISLLAFALTACALYAARRRSRLPQGKARIRGRWAVVAVGVGYQDEIGGDGVGAGGRESVPRQERVGQHVIFPVKEVKTGMS